MKNKITIEKAIEDLTLAEERFRTLGPGSDMDRLAQMVIQPLQVLQNRLAQPSILKMLYLDNEEAYKLLPGGVIELVQKICDEQISPEEAKNELKEMVDMYRQAFEQMGITPRVSEMLFMKF